MKHITTLCAMAAIAATALSCSKETAMKTISVTLGAPQEPADTKTVVTGGSHIQWTAADKNILCITTDGGLYLMTSDESTQKAAKTFTGTIPADKEPMYYYYDMNKTKNFGVTPKPGGILREILGNNVACWTAGSFPTTLNYAVAKPGDSAFRNVNGYFKWTNNGNAIKAVKFETLTKGEYFAGYFDVDYNGADPQTEKYYTNENNVTACSPYVISSIGNSSIPADKSYYAIVIPGTYHGIKISIYLAEGYDANKPSFVIKSDATFTVERGKYIDFGVLPVAAL